MTFSSPLAVVSGKRYEVRRVQDHAPRELADFAGQTTFILDLEGEDYVVWGAGVRANGVVRVFEKDEQGYGKDIRVWSVRQDPVSASFTAEHSVS
jgi:hypothetical protein